MNQILAIALYLNNTISQSCLLSIIKLFNDSNLDFDTLDYSVSYLSPQNLYKSHNRSGKYSEKRITSFYNHLTEFDSILCSSIEINKQSKKIDYKILDIAYSILYSTGDSFNTITIAISDDYSSTVNFKALTIKAIGILRDHNTGLFYGKTLCMNADKMPLLYTNGISNNNLDKDEFALLERFNNHSSEIRERIWDISWGNLINAKQFVNDKTPDHLKQSKDLETIVFNDELIWFNFSCDIRDFKSLANTSWKRVAKYFNEKLM